LHNTKETKMSEQPIERCPECEELASGEALGRRDFMRVVGVGVGAVAVGTIPAVARAAVETTKKPAKPAEDLIKELYFTLSDTQRNAVVLPWNHTTRGGVLTRMGMYNAPIENKKIGDNYSKAQQDLLNRIIRAIISEDDQAYKRISRNGTWDMSGSFQGCGALIFRDPEDGQKFSWMFTGHHLTLRCDGNSLEGAAFGGPMYYGHSPNGYTEANVFYYQTKTVLEVFKSLDAKQQTKAIVGGNPGEQARSVQFRKPEEAKPGIACTELSAEQKALVEIVLKSLLSPYRKEDADEVLEILKANGGLDKLHLAFYKDNLMNDRERWHFWRLEGPGFVWHYRILPHVHCYVNIAAAKV